MSDLNDDFVLHAIKESLTDFTINWALKTKQTDKEFSYEWGVCTARIASNLNVKTSEARKKLKDMEKRGLLYSRKDTHTFTWWPIGYLDELKATLYS